MIIGDFKKMDGNGEQHQNVAAKEKLLKHN